MARHNDKRDRDTLPPGSDDAAARAFEAAIQRRGEWRARLENLSAVAGLVREDTATEHKAAA